MNYQQPPRLRTREEEERAETTEGDRESEGGATDAEFMWFRVELWHLDVIHFTLSRGIHLPPSCNYGALFPLLIHLNVCLCLFLVTIRAHTRVDVHTHTQARTTKPLSSVINPSLLAVVVFLFCSPLCSGSWSCFPSLCIISFVPWKHNMEPPSPHNTGTRGGRDRREYAL